MIPEHKYSEYYWITLINHTNDEWESFKQQMSVFPNAFIYDGVDEETHSLCFKFSRHKPTHEQDIKRCKDRNLAIKKDVLKVMSKNVGGKFYFNIKRGILKKL